MLNLFKKKSEKDISARKEKIMNRAIKAFRASGYVVIREEDFDKAVHAEALKLLKKQYDIFDEFMRG